MYLRSRLFVTAVAVVALIVGLSGGYLFAQQASGAKRTILQQKDIAGVAGREIVMYLAETPAGGTSGKHTHPGWDTLYILEGTMVFEMDGEAPKTLNAGDTHSFDGTKVHNVTNKGQGSLKVLAFLVGEKGKPLSTPVP